MLSLGLNLLGFINGYYVAGAVDTYVGAGSWGNAASVFAVQIGIGAAAFAIVGRGNLGQMLGLLIGFLVYLS